MTRVVIEGFGRSVTVEADVSLVDAKAVALEIFDKTSDPNASKGFGVTGMITEVASPLGDEGVSPGLSCVGAGQWGGV